MLFCSETKQNGLTLVTWHSIGLGICTCAYTYTCTTYTCRYNYTYNFQVLNVCNILRSVWELARLTFHNITQKIWPKMEWEHVDVPEQAKCDGIILEDREVKLNQFICLVGVLVPVCVYCVLLLPTV